MDLVRTQNLLCKYYIRYFIVIFKDYPSLLISRCHKTIGLFLGNRTLMLASTRSVQCTVHVIMSMEKTSLSLPCKMNETKCQEKLNIWYYFTGIWHNDCLDLCSEIHSSILVITTTTNTKVGMHRCILHYTSKLAHIDSCEPFCVNGISTSTNT